MIRQESDVPAEGIASAAMPANLEAAEPKVTVVVLVACRDNPYRQRAKRTDKGLARISDVGEGMLVAYMVIYIYCIPS